MLSVASNGYLNREKIPVANTSIYYLQLPTFYRLTNDKNTIASKFWYSERNIVVVSSISGRMKGEQ